MNIYVLDKDPRLAAKYHTNKHVIKMILESVQMMSTTVRLVNNIETKYRSTHLNHPCTIWTRTTITNYFWLMKLVHYLNEEYKYRFDHKENHKSYNVMLDLPYPNILNVGLTEFAQAMPNQYRSSNVVDSYRLYYLKEKQHLFEWGKRGKPYWV